MSCQLETGGKRRGEVALTAPDGGDTTKAPGNVPEAEGVPKGGTKRGEDRRKPVGGNLREPAVNVM